MPKKIEISVPVATAVGLGAIIGAGIFVLSGTAIAVAGTDALLAFIAVGVVAVILALELGELSSMMPDVKGASYSYTFLAFGRRLGFITGIYRYLAIAISVSVISLGFGAYLSSLLGLSTDLYSIPFAIFLIAALSIINLLGIEKAAKTDSVLVLVKVMILIIFIAFAIYVYSRGIGEGSTNFNFNLSFTGLQGIFAASVAIFFAYSGFQSIATFSARIKGKGDGAAKAILWAVLISITLYVLVVLSLLLLLPASSYKIAADPLSFALMTSHAPSWLILLVGIGALIATTSASLAMLLTGSRSIYQMSEDGLLPKVLMSYNKKADFAPNGILVTAIIAVIMLFAGNLYIIAAMVTFALMFDYMIIGFDIIHFRRMGKKAVFRIPLYPLLPIVGILVLLSFFVSLPLVVLELGAVIFIVLIAFYHFFLRNSSESVVALERLRKREGVA